MEVEVEIIHMYTYTWVTTCLNAKKKEARQVNQKFFDLYYTPVCIISLYYKQMA